MEMKVGLTFAYMNLKKLEKMKVKKGQVELGYTTNKLKCTKFTPKMRKALLA